MKTVKDIVKRYLDNHGYDGLWHENECGCKKDDLIPCCDAITDCHPGILKECNCSEGCGWHIGPGEPKKPTPSPIARDAAVEINTTVLPYTRYAVNEHRAKQRIDFDAAIIQAAINADRRERKDWVLLGKCIEVLCGASNFIHNNEIMQVIRQDTALEEIYAEVEDEIKDVMKRAAKGVTR